MREIVARVRISRQCHLTYRLLLIAPNFNAFDAMELIAAREATVSFDEHSPHLDEPRETYVVDRDVA
jgi:hypothetical protein